MKIEKINDNQVKFILSKHDLSDRDIKFKELEYGSEKTQELFHEMMEQASIEYDFRTENTPLMIEAIPITMDSIMIIVTKISNLKDLDAKLGLFSDEEYQPRSVAKSKPVIDNYASKISSSRNNVAIYYFNSLDDVISVSKKIVGIFNGLSSVYKYNRLYFLVLESRQTQKAGYILSEYGQKYISNIKSKYHLIEHGETITKEFAVEKYAMMS